MQPATLDYLRDAVIDDSRARKMIGYRHIILQNLILNTDVRTLGNSYKPQWQMAQIMKYTVDQLETGQTNGQHGLKMTSSGS
jgi:hypothetical protein